MILSMKKLSRNLYQKQKKEPVLIDSMFFKVKFNDGINRVTFELAFEYL